MSTAEGTVLDVGEDTPGGQASADFKDLAGQAEAGQIKPGEEAAYMVNAPQIKLPDFSKLPSITSFVPKIQEAGRLKLESGLSALRQGYGQQSEELETQLGASGTYDSGDKYKLQKRMFEGRASQEGQLIYQIQAETLAQEVSELQRTGQIEEERARMIMDMEFNKAIQEGNWSQAAAIHNADTQMQIKTFNQKSLELTADLQAKGYDAALAWVDRQIAGAELGIKDRGLDVEENKVEIAKYEADMKGCISSHGENNSEVSACISNAKAEFEAAIAPESPEGADAGAPAAPVAGDAGGDGVGVRLNPGELEADIQSSVGEIGVDPLQQIMQSKPGSMITHRGRTYQKQPDNSWIRTG